MSEVMSVIIYNHAPVKQTVTLSSTSAEAMKEKGAELLKQGYSETGPHIKNGKYFCKTYYKFVNIEDLIEESSLTEGSKVDFRFDLRTVLSTRTKRI